MEKSQKNTKQIGESVFERIIRRSMEQKCALEKLLHELQKPAPVSSSKKYYSAKTARKLSPQHNKGAQQNKKNKHSSDDSKSSDE